LTTLFIRPEAHEIDTLARRKVALSFPSQWEHRELTGRDYGIDIIIEIFDNGCATGKTLSLQIKGTREKINNLIRELKFDIPVRTLKYSEMFISPVILVVCPVDEKNNKFYYLWLQEYIGVVLNNDNPEWRKNRCSVRASIPIENCMPGDENKLEFVSNYPRRIFEWCQFARICEDMKYPLNDFFSKDDIEIDENEKELFEEHQLDIRSELIKIKGYVHEIINLQSIFCEPEWRSPQSILEDIIKPSLNSIDNLLNNKYKNREYEKRIIFGLSSISSLLSLYNDYRYSNVLWDYYRDHDF